MEPLIVIEYPAQGATYRDNAYGVYRYDTYPQGSVLDGQERRSALGQFPSLEAARKEFPGAEWNGPGGTGYRDAPLADPLACWAAVLDEPWDDPYETCDD